MNNNNQEENLSELMYWDRMDKIFPDKSELKKTIVKDFEVNAITSSLIMTITFSGIFNDFDIVDAFLIDNNEYSDKINEILTRIYIYSLFLSTLFSSLAFLLSIFELLLVLKTTDRNIIETMSRFSSIANDICGFNIFEFRYIQLSILCLLISINANFFLIFGFTDGLILGIISLLGLWIYSKIHIGYNIALYEKILNTEY